MPAKETKLQQGIDEGLFANYFILGCCDHEILREKKSSGINHFVRDPWRPDIGMVLYKLQQTL